MIFVNILIVDGNDKKSSEEYTKLGMNTQFEEYKNILIISAEVRGNDLAVNYLVFNNFAKANLENANFKNAGLEFVSFKKANLTNADLSETDLRSTFFANADLSGADLTDIILDEGVFLNCKNHPRCLYGQ